MRNSYLGAVCGTLLLFTITAVGQHSTSGSVVKAKGPTTSDEVQVTSSDAESKLEIVPAALAGTNPRPQGDTNPEKWSFEISPYIWAAALKGDLRVRNTTAHVDASFSDIFHNLDFSFATAAEAIKGKWRVLIDENYVNLGTTGTGPLGETTDVQPTLNFFEVGASYAPVIIRNKNSTANEPLPPVFSLEVLGGLRYTHFGLGLQRGTNPAVEGSRNLVDFFGGNRFKIRPYPKVTLIEKYTLGGGGSHFAWTFSSTVDYRFRRCLSAWGGYQVLSMDADEPANVVGFNGHLRGLIFGMTIHK